MKKMSIFGATGYVGSHFFNSDTDIAIPREEKTPASKDVLYFISTTDNYNVFSDVHIDIDTNLSLLVDVLENWKNTGITQGDGVFNYISTWFVYGKNTKLPMNEESSTDPNGFYSVTKLCAEHLVRSFCETHDLSYRILRLCSVCCGDDKSASAKKNALHFLIEKIKCGQNVNVYHGGDFLRSYMHVEDVCDAIRLVCDKGEKNTIYNIAPDEPSKFIDLLLYAKEITASKSMILPAKPPRFHDVVQIKDAWVSNKKLKQLGFTQKHSLRSGIFQLCQSK